MKTFAEFVEELELGFAEELFHVTEEQYEDNDEPDEEAFIYEFLDEAKGKVWTGKKPKKSMKEEAEHEGRKVKLNKPFLTPAGPKKRSVYVKNDKGNVVKVNFGDPNMRIKKSSPAHRKSFRARHGCDVDPGPRWKAKYWSCKMW